MLQFYDNQRPPYFGTWTKTSDKVNARKPFAMDSEYFDYDYDSDDDWEEEEQGESLSDEEKDKEEVCIIFGATLSEKKYFSTYITIFCCNFTKNFFYFFRMRKKLPKGQTKTTKMMVSSLDMVSWIKMNLRPSKKMAMKVCIFWNNFFLLRNFT